jgi:hypothetical protein
MFRVDSFFSVFRVLLSCLSFDFHFVSLSFVSCLVVFFLVLSCLSCPILSCGGLVWSCDYLVLACGCLFFLSCLVSCGCLFVSCLLVLYCCGSLTVLFLAFSCECLLLGHSLLANKFLGHHASFWATLVPQFDSRLVKFLFLGLGIAQSLRVQSGKGNIIIDNTLFV